MTGGLTVLRARSRVRPGRHRAHGQCRRRLHDPGHEADLVVELPALQRGQLAHRLDGDGELAARAPLVPHAADHAVDEQHRVVAGLARWGERAGGGRPWVQQFSWLTRHDVGVEVGQQADAGMRTQRCPGIAREGPGRLAIKLGTLQRVGQPGEQPGGVPGRKPGSQRCGLV